MRSITWLAVGLLHVAACDGGDDDNGSSAANDGDTGSADGADGADDGQTGSGAVLDVTLGSQRLLVDSGVTCVDIPESVSFVYGGSGTTDDGESFMIGGQFGGPGEDNQLTVTIGNNEYWTVSQAADGEMRGEYLELSVDTDARTATGRAIMDGDAEATEMATFDIRC
jgi:hypothetical protein